MSAPETPRHSRNSSAIDSMSGSPNARRHSKSSLNDFATPYRNSFNQQDALDMNLLNSGGPGAVNGMGNLADELAEAFSDSEEGEEDQEDSVINETPSASKTPIAKELGNEAITSPYDSKFLSPDKKAHKRKESAYDGSEYGSESDLDSPGFPSSLVAKIDAVDSLARRGTEDYGGPENNVFNRVTDSLRDLGSQSSVEGSASRLITAHSALTTHLAHQTRQLQTLTYALLSPLVAPPDPDTIDDLLPLLISLAEEMPRPSTSAFNSLTALHSLTADLVQTLNYLSDTLHMSRQTTGTATRRLKSAKELVADIRRDDELRDEGEVWLTRGNWGERLENRECAGVCKDVIGGFEEVCNGWRERLLAQAEPQA